MVNLTIFFYYGGILGQHPSGDDFPGQLPSDVGISINGLVEELSSGALVMSSIKPWASLKCQCR